MFYWVLKTVVLGPLLKLLFRPWVEGEEHIPEEGAAIFASNHLSFSDSIFLPLMVPRRMTFLAKSDYFTGRGIKGKAHGGVLQGRRPGTRRPVRWQGRRGRAQLRSADPASRRAARHLPRGHPLARRPALPRPHRRRPDGPRGRRPGPPGRDDRHRQGPAHRQEAPADHAHRHPDRQARSSFARYEGMEDDRFVLRSITDEIMYELMLLSGQEYVDEYATSMKDRIVRAAKVTRPRAAGGRPSGQRRQGARGGARRGGGRGRPAGVARRRRADRRRRRDAVDDAGFDGRPGEAGERAAS